MRWNRKRNVRFLPTLNLNAEYKHAGTKRSDKKAWENSDGARIRERISLRVLSKQLREVKISWFWWNSKSVEFIKEVWDNADSDKK